MVTKSTKRNYAKRCGYKVKKGIISLFSAAALISAMASVPTAFADDYTWTSTRIDDSSVVFENTCIPALPRGTRSHSLLLGDDEDLIIMELDKVSNPYDEYRVSLYDLDDKDDYVFKYTGPISTSRLIISGLEGGNHYYLLISSTSNVQLISGKIYTAKSGDKLNEPKEQSSNISEGNKSSKPARHSAPARTFADVSLNDAIYESVKDLSQLGILSGYADGTVKPENTITRAEFAEIAAKVLPPTIKADAGEGSTFIVTSDGMFLDINDSFWGTNSIIRMTQMGYINGYEDNTFRAENNITYNEAIKIIIEMLNYGCYARNIGGYPHGYITQAMTLGITKGLSFDGNSPATRGDVILMIENMLDVPHLVITEYDANFNSDIACRQSSLTYRMMHENNYPGEGIS